MKGSGLRHLKNYFNERLPLEFKNSATSKTFAVDEAISLLARYFETLATAGSDIPVAKSHQLRRSLSVSRLHGSSNDLTALQHARFSGDFPVVAFTDFNEVPLYARPESDFRSLLVAQ
jgi:hypothetical protein